MLIRDESGAIKKVESIKEVTREELANLITRLENATEKARKDLAEFDRLKGGGTPTEAVVAEPAQGVVNVTGAPAGNTPQDTEEPAPNIVLQ